MNEPESSTTPENSKIPSEKTEAPDPKIITMSSPPVTSALDQKLDEKVLEAAWRQLLDYDEVSTNQKNLYQRVQMRVIALGLIASFLAVMIGYIQSDFMSYFFPSIFGFIRALLVIIPVTVVMLVKFAADFTGTTVWIEYRVAAEIIRSNIYLFRMNAGPYRNLPPEQRRQKLMEMTQRADDSITSGTLPHLNLLDGEDDSTKPMARRNWMDGRIVDVMLKQVIGLSDAGANKVGNVRQRVKSDHKTNHRDDEGFNALDIERYVEWRLKQQFNWYVRKVGNDYRALQRFRFGVLFVGAMGAVLAALDLRWAPLVAITTASAVALNSRASVNMFGSTYNIFHWAAKHLQDRLDTWNTSIDRSPDAVAKFVEDVEKIFADERDEWSKLATQLQNASEQNILRNIGQIEQEGDAKLAGTIIPPVKPIGK